MSVDPFEDSLFEADSDDDARLSLSGLVQPRTSAERHQRPVHRGARGGGKEYRERDVWGGERGWRHSERGRAEGQGYGQDWDMDQSIHDLEESQVLEDVFFIK